MKKLSYVCGALLMLGSVSSLKAQLIDEKDVSITMDLQPVLQLNMTTPDQIEFTFDEINEYYAGITKYGATVLRVSSTVSWDLYAVGRSTGTNGPEFWDQQVQYGSGTNPNAVPNLPMSLLELRQSQPNNGAVAILTTPKDYRAAFSPAITPSNGNSLYVFGGTNTPPAATGKYIGGHKGVAGAAFDSSIPGGSYLTQTGTTSNYFYVIDYRILPGLPAIFPMAFDETGAISENLTVAPPNPSAYAEPGVYTMYVQYILLEDQ